MPKKPKSSVNKTAAIILIIILTVSFLIQPPLIKLLLSFIFFIGAVVFISLKLYLKYGREVQVPHPTMDEVDRMPGKAFEHYVAELMVYRGFQTQVTKGSGDLGVDIVALHGRLRYAVQCKRYSKDISRTAVSDAVGGVKSYKCQVPVVVTNRYFTKGAKELARANKCVLIDRDILAQWIDDYRYQRPIQRLLN